MAKNKYSKGTGSGFKTVTCSQTGEEVTRRKSLAINYKGDGRGGVPADACKRIKRELAPKPAPLYIPQVAKRPEAILTDNIKQVVKAVKTISSREKAQLKKILQGKRNEDT